MLNFLKPKYSKLDLDILDYLYEHAVLFGSRSLNVHDAKSDYDFLITRENFKAFEATFDITCYIMNNTYTLLEDCHKYNCHLSNGIRLDLITPSLDRPYVFSAALQTAHILKSIPIDFNRDRRDRYELFGQIFCSIKNSKPFPAKVLPYVTTYFPELLV